MNGKVEGIFIASEERGPIQSVDTVNAVAGRGLEGDRYFKAGDALNSEPTEEITLFESEAIEKANAETDIAVEPQDMRRNVMTSGLDLVALIGKRLRIGEVEVEAMEDNPPCRYLTELTGKDLLKPLIRKGGVRGRIVTSGTISSGDTIEVIES